MDKKVLENAMEKALQTALPESIKQQAKELSGQIVRSVVLQLKKDRNFKEKLVELAKKEIIKSFPKKLAEGISSGKLYLGIDS